jgi:hypothetical protein
LTVRFNYPVEYDVRGAADFRSITVTVLHAAVPSPPAAPSLDRAQKEDGRPAPLAKGALEKLSQPIGAAPGDKIAALMEEARQMMAKANYSRAVQLYTKVLETPAHPLAREALEFLGLARERKKQFAHAKRIYDQYLERYPDTEGAERVEQRILAMITATQQPKPSLRASKEGPRTVAGRAKETADGVVAQQAVEYDFFGGFSQFYRYNAIAIQGSGSDPTQSAVANDLDISGRLRSDAVEISSRFSGGGIPVTCWKTVPMTTGGSVRPIFSLAIARAESQYGSVVNRTTRMGYSGASTAVCSGIALRNGSSSRR